MRYSLRYDVKYYYNFDTHTGRLRCYIYNQIQEYFQMPFGHYIDFDYNGSDLDDTSVYFIQYNSPCTTRHWRY
jgi:hypothetical protein